MKNRAFSSVFFIIILLGVCIFIANKYLAHIETNAANRYLSTLQSELNAHKITLNFAPINCTGFIKHTCESKQITLDSANFAESKQIILRNAKLAIKSLGLDNIVAEAKIGDISQNLILLPKNLTYNLALKKVDSALGYVMVERRFDFTIGNIAGRVDLAILVRDRRFANKSIFYLIKEWFDAETPSFYEYSLENLEVDLRAKNAVDSAIFKKNEVAMGAIFDSLKNPHFAPLIDATKALMNNERKNLHFKITRKNADLKFFHTLSQRATHKKLSEIGEILASVDESYEVNLR
ncbi:hypothetical protein [Helicobacter sp. 23-1045]